MGNVLQVTMAKIFARVINIQILTNQEANAIEGYFVDGSPLDIFTGGTLGVDVGLDVVSLTK